MERVRPVIASGGLPPVSMDMLENAIYTPANSGAWFVIAMPGGQQMFGYHATSVIGGGIPDRLVAEFVLSSMEKLLRRIETRAAEEVADHYVGAHEPIAAGDGGWVPTW